MTVRGDAFLWQVGIGSALKQQLDDIDMSAGGCVFQRRSRAYVISNILRDSIGQRGILIEQLSNPIEVSDTGGCANVAVCSPRAQVCEHLGRRGRDILWYIPPAAIMIVAIG